MIFVLLWSSVLEDGHLVSMLEDLIQLMVAQYKQLPFILDVILMTKLLLKLYPTIRILFFSLIQLSCILSTVSCLHFSGL